MNATTKYAGWYGKINGRKVFVVNESETQYKVRLGVIAGYSGWSGGAYPNYSFASKPVWVNKSEVN